MLPSRLALFTLACVPALLVACMSIDEVGGARASRDRRDKVTIRGSDTMVILAQRWAEVFMQSRDEASVQVSGGGSGTGITGLIDRTTDIATASRKAKDSERARVEAPCDAGTSRRKKLVETIVALDAVAVYVHDDNPIAALTLPQVKAIFRGHTTDWSALGLDLGPLVLYSRENNSGTYAFFKEVVLHDEDFAAEAQTLPGTSAVINAVSKDPGAIGYGGIGFATGARVVPILLPDGRTVSPSRENAANGTYPLTRPLFLYTVDEPAGLAKDYIEFALSEPGQALVEELGYFPLASERTP